MKGLWKKPLLKYLAILGLALILFSPLYMYFSNDVSLLNSQYPHLKIDASHRVTVTIKPGKPRHWVNLKDISSYGKWAIILTEDWAYYQHQGLDVEQIKVALNEMMSADRFRGASTITQQMVKNVLLSEYPTLWRKLHEIILAQKVEKVLSKGRILELYLNSIEFGPGIYGMKNASFHYFKKHPSGLGARESAFLAMLLPSPKRYYVSFKKKRLTKFANLRIKAILVKMRMGKILSVDQYESELHSKFSWEK